MTTEALRDQMAEAVLLVLARGLKGAELQTVGKYLSTLPEEIRKVRMFDALMHLEEFGE